MQDSQFLLQAIDLAGQSKELIGCGVVIVSDGKVIAHAYNSQKTDNIAVNHAEIKAIIQANRKLGSRKIANTTAYCSCEPCAMCLTALSYAKVARIVFNKTMHDLFPNDPQSKFDPYTFVSQLNFTPTLEQLKL